MNSKLFSISTKLSLHTRKARSENLFKTLIGNAIAGRAYYSKRSGKPSLYSTISPLGNPSISLSPELDQWVEKGKKVRVAELHRIVHDFRRRKRFSQALEVSEWMSTKGVCKFSSSEHAVQLDLIGRVRGFVSAESYFSELMEEYKTDKTYGALLNCYVRERQTDKFLTHLEKMKQMGFASGVLTYNDIMCLYTNTGQHEKVPDVLMEMKQNNVSPDNFSYRICMNSYGVRSDIEGVERLLKEMEAQPHIKMDWNTYCVVADFYIKAGRTDNAIDALKKSEERLDKKDSAGYNFLITLHAKLGNKAEILRLWDLKKTSCKKFINRDYLTMLRSLVRLGEFEEALKLIKDWESSGNYYDLNIPNIVIIGYTDKGLFEEAEAVLNDFKRKGKETCPGSWGIVAAGYLKKGETEKAMDSLKIALSLSVDKKGWKPNQRVIAEILSWLGDEGSIDEVKDFVDLVGAAIPVNREMYHALLKAYIRSGKNVDGLLNSMKADEIIENKETKKILAMVQENVQ